MNIVRNGSGAAAIVCSIWPPVKIGLRLASDTFGRSEESIRLVGLVSVPAKSASCELVDPPGDAKYDKDGRLAPSGATHLAHHRREIVGGHVVELTAAESGAQMLLDSVPIAGLCGRPEVEHRAIHPLVRRVTESKPGIACDNLAATSPSKQSVAQSPRRHDPAVDRPPALDSCAILEADFEDA